MAIKEGASMMSPSRSMSASFELIDLEDDNTTIQTPILLDDDDDKTTIKTPILLDDDKTTIQTPILIDDDDDCSVVDLTQDEENEMDQDNHHNWTVDEDEDEDEEEDEDDDTLEIIEQFIDHLTLEEQDDAMARTEHRASSDPLSIAIPALTGTGGNKIPRFNLAVIDKYMIGDWELKPGMFVELIPEEMLNQSAGDFILIDTILEDMASEEVFLRGTKFRRTHCLKGMLEKKLNEVYMIQRHNQQDSRTIGEQSFEEVPAHLVLCVRTLVTTNQPYPNCSWRVWNPLKVDKDRASVKERAQLVCRSKYTIVYSSPVNQRAGRIEEQRIERINQTESGVGFAMSDPALRQMARSPNNSDIVDLTKEQALGSYKENMHKHGLKQGYVNLGTDRSTAINLEDNDNTVTIEISDDDEKPSSTGIRRNIRTRRTQEADAGASASASVESMLGDEYQLLDQPPRSNFGRRFQSSSRRTSSSTSTSTPHRYTFGDGFCGAGGVSRGATDAGLNIRWAFDKWDRACHTYRRNFMGVKIFKKEAYDFIIRWRDTRTVDILHLSPPCQKFSPAHTVAGKDDEENEASLFAVGYMIQKAKPRIVTIEETAGIKTHHPIFLHALILQLTRLGYSVAWKVMNFAEYGLAQPRKRLIIIGSCPGEPLPPFPERTRGPGLRGFATIREALQDIREGMPNQDYSRTVPKEFSAYSFDTQLKSCITCGGGQGNLFPSGRRTFTERELACLQGFPTEHRFWGKRGEVKRQIGNAVPPLFAKQLYETIIKTLRATDAAEAARDKSARVESAPNTPHHVKKENVKKENAHLYTPGPSRSSLPRPIFAGSVFGTPGSSKSAGSKPEDAIMID